MAIRIKKTFGKDLFITFLIELPFVKINSGKFYHTQIIGTGFNTHEIMPENTIKKIVGKKIFAEKFICQK